MQTSFTLAQLADPHIEEAERILRKCVHCGFCTATCPTYVLLGDELDGPRGRIMLIKAMLESSRAPSAKVVTHIDRCLSCLSCMTTCPSGVDYGRLVDRARAHIDETFQRPWAEIMLRGLLAIVLPRPALFRLALVASQALPSWLSRQLPGRLAGLVAMAPAALPDASMVGQPQTHNAAEPRRLRVALLPGCARMRSFACSATAAIAAAADEPKKARRLIALCVIGGTSPVGWAAILIAWISATSLENADRDAGRAVR